MMKLRYSYCFILFSIGFIFTAAQSNAEEVEHSAIPNFRMVPTTANPDSGIFDTIAKGYKIASNLSIEDLGKMATIVITNKNKTVGNITKDVTSYLTQIGTAKSELKKIKINKNTRVYIKRDNSN